MARETAMKARPLQPWEIDDRLRQMAEVRQAYACYIGSIYARTMPKYALAEGGELIVLDDGLTAEMRSMIEELRAVCARQQRRIWEAR